MQSTDAIHACLTYFRPGLPSLLLRIVVPYNSSRALQYSAYHLSTIFLLSSGSWIYPCSECEYSCMWRILLRKRCSIDSYFSRSKWCRGVSTSSIGSHLLRWSAQVSIHPRRPTAYGTYAAIENGEHLFRRQTMNVASVYNNSQTITVRNWTCGIEQLDWALEPRCCNSTRRKRLYASMNWTISKSWAVMQKLNID